MKTRLHLGPVPAVALNTNLIVACEHVGRPFTAATITLEGGQPYREDYVWEDRDGVKASVRACDFAFRERINSLPDDMIYCRPWRPVFSECIVELQRVVEGDGVWIESKRLGWVSSHVIAFYMNSPRQPVLRFKPESGDSGTLVWTADRSRVVGFISGSDGRGAVVRAPDTGFKFANLADLPAAPAPTPAPIVPPPAPEPVVPPPPLRTPEARIAKLRDSGELMVRSILENCPDNRERALAITQLQTALLWAGTAISPAPVFLAR